MNTNATTPAARRDAYNTADEDATPLSHDGAPPARLDHAVARREPHTGPAVHNWTATAAEWDEWSSGARCAELRTAGVGWHGLYHHPGATVDVTCNASGRRVRLVITHVARVTFEREPWDLISTRRAYAHE